MALFGILYVIVYIFWAWCGWKIATSLGKMVVLMQDYLERIDHTLATFPVGYLDKTKGHDKPE